MQVSEVKTLPKTESGLAEPVQSLNLDSEIEVVEQGTYEMRFGTGKKLGKDGCGY